MVSTVTHLLDYYDRQRASAGLTGPSRAILWAHNSHLGDARHTIVSRSREWNIGQLCRQQWGLHQTFNIGFTTYDGTVSATRRWGAERGTMTVNPGLEGSYEDVMHRVATLPPPPARVEERKEEVKEQKVSSGGGESEGERDFALLFRSNSSAVVDSAVVRQLESSRLERAIGVQYVDKTELQSHYMQCSLSKQFDAVPHRSVDCTGQLIARPPQLTCCTQRPFQSPLTFVLLASSGPFICLFRCRSTE